MSIKIKVKTLLIRPRLVASANKNGSLEKYIKRKKITVFIATKTEVNLDINEMQLSFHIMHNPSLV